MKSKFLEKAIKGIKIGKGQKEKTFDEKLKKTQERFWSKVELSPGCWDWTASFRKKTMQYGCFSISGINYRASRISWMLSFGDIPEGKVVCHSCDNPKCVNPDHLWLGTQRENLRDSQEKGRRPNRVPDLSKKFDWVIKYIKKTRAYSVNTLDYEFLEAYVENFPTKKVNEADVVAPVLLKMFRLDLLRRKALGVSPSPYAGAPKWCWHYFLP